MPALPQQAELANHGTVPVEHHRISQLSLKEFRQHRSKKLRDRRDVCHLIDVDLFTVPLVDTLNPWCELARTLAVGNGYGFQANHRLRKMVAARFAILIDELKIAVLRDVDAVKFAHAPDKPMLEIIQPLWSTMAENVRKPLSGSGAPKDVEMLKDSASRVSLGAPSFASTLLAGSVTLNRTDLVDTTLAESRAASTLRLSHNKAITGKAIS